MVLDGLYFYFSGVGCHRALVSVAVIKKYFSYNETNPGMCILKLVAQNNPLTKPFISN